MITNELLAITQNTYTKVRKGFIYINITSYDLDICTPVSSIMVYSWKTTRKRTLSKSNISKYVIVNKESFIKWVQSIQLTPQQLEYKVKYYGDTIHEGMVFGGWLYGVKLTTHYVLSNLVKKNKSLEL